MKGNKSVLVVAILLLLISASFTTYAIYRSSANGNATIETANWVVEVNGTDIVTESEFTLDDFDFGNNPNGKNDKIAPGDSGTVDIEIDATGSEVDVNYAITLGELAAQYEDLFTITVGNDGEGTILYDESDMTETVTVTLTWLGAESDDANKDQADIDIKASEIVIPVTVVAKQVLN